MSKRKRVTIREVGEHAGVSYQTVSRVLNESGPVSAEARERVELAIRELGYVPDPVAATLANRTSRVIGIVTATYEGNACVQTLEGAGAYLERHGYAVVIGGGEHRSRAEPEMLPFLKQQRVEGLLIIYHGSEDDSHRLLSEIPPNIPVVTVGYAHDRENVLAVGVDSEAGARTATEHLISLGHRRIAVIAGAPHAYETVQRDAGYSSAMTRAGLEVDERLAESGDWFIESGYEATMRLLERSSDFTALFAHSDRMAVGAIRALLDRGLRVPADVAVVGFNDISLARYAVPPLTTVHYPLYELGEICGRLVIARANAEPGDEAALTDDEIRRLEPHLVVRESCGAASGRRRPAASGRAVSGRAVSGGAASGGAARHIATEAP